jgi:hypothetical protein
MIKYEQRQPERHIVRGEVDGVIDEEPPAGQGEERGDGPQPHPSGSVEVGFVGSGRKEQVEDQGPCCTESDEREQHRPGGVAPQVQQHQHEYRGDEAHRMHQQHQEQGHQHSEDHE